MFNRGSADAQRPKDSGPVHGILETGRERRGNEGVEGEVMDKHNSSERTEQDEM